MTTAEIRAKIAAVPYWWHHIDLNGIVTPGHCNRSAQDLGRLHLPDLRGKTLLDVGCWDGYYSFAAEKLGAKVTAIDPLYRATDGPLNDPELGTLGFRTAKEILGSQVTFRQLGVFGLPNGIPPQDVVLFLGVLYHIKHPLLALEKLREITAGLLILETQYIWGRKSLMVYRPKIGKDETNWWVPTISCLKGMLRKAGFSHIKIVHRNLSRVVVHAT